VFPEGVLAIAAIFEHARPGSVGGPPPRGAGRAGRAGGERADPAGSASGSGPAGDPGRRPLGAARLLGLAVATAGGAGLVPAAPGTAGAAVAARLFWGLQPLGLHAWAVALVVSTVAGVPAADAAGRTFGRTDDRRIVIDEVAGQLLALAPLLAAWSPGPPAARTGEDAVWVVTGFVAFRVFDIAKPGPVRWTERSFRGGWGVMLDDLVAGAMAAAVLAALLAARSLLAGAGGGAP